MERKDNYAIHAQQAKQRFLTYDQQKLVEKLGLKADEAYLYMTFLSWPYRISRCTGDVEFFRNGTWQDGNSYEEVMTLLDLVCDSKENRWITGRWKNMRDFGLMFHTSLLETQKDPWADRFQTNPEGFESACRALGGEKLSYGDIAYAIELFDGLCICLQLWFGDEEFPPNLRILWDENALMYLKYETMYFARGLLLSRIREEMERKGEEI